MNALEWSLGLGLLGAGQLAIVGAILALNRRVHRLERECFQLGRLIRPPINVYAQDMPDVWRFDA